MPSGNFGSLPTGTFSSPNAGRLQLSLIASFYANTYADAGFPASGGSGGNLAIRGYAGPTGSLTYTTAMEKWNSGTVVVEMDYPGGNAVWNIGIEECGFKAPSGLASFGFQNIQLVARLKKR